ncbi:MAG: aromatic ring-hydroxylating dioxygenase subunit alpha [Henriciella sp.]|nr:aromatic ring-hydroxylating dioxygenase subunit alpha [Henriciella sp.]
MLGEAKNKLLTRVGPGEPMGNLLRRYWMPIAAEADYQDQKVTPIRLMGEDLVLYRDGKGNLGLVDRQCPHRRADLSYGYTEDCGLRCNYHGWLFDKDGACLEQPYEDVAAPERKFREKVKIKAYPLERKAGLIWAYMGPMPAPLLPDWEPFNWPNGFKQIVFTTLPCNWFQCQENSIDPVHFEWMHANWAKRLRGEDGRAPRHLKVAFDEFEHGLVYKRIREDTDETNPLWTVGRTALWPNAFFLGDHFEWRVPIDDENTLSVTWAFFRVPTEAEPFEQDTIPAWEAPLIDETTGRWITSHVMNQDFVAWVGQGTIADRAQERLGTSDAGIIKMRKLFFDDLEKIDRGEDPKGIIRDPAENQSIKLPVAERDLLLRGAPRAALATHPIWAKHMQDFPFCAGQPETVRDAFRAAIGEVSEDA